MKNESKHIKIHHIFLIYVWVGGALYSILNDMRKFILKTGKDEIRSQSYEAEIVKIICHVINRAEIATFYS